MSRYRPVDVRLWNDRKFLSLSGDARLLWVFLLTAPSSLPIPGVIIGGDFAIAEQLGLDPKLLGGLFDELFTKELSIRRDGRLIWLSNALKYQPPRNPNMLKGWSETWDDIPECPLKLEIWEALNIACKSWSKLFGQLFRQPLPALFAKQEAKQLSQDQEQEQEQEQEKKGRRVRAAVLSPEEARARTELHTATQEFFARYETAYQAKPTWGAKQGGQLQALLKKHSLAEVSRRMEIMFTAPPDWLKGPHDLGTLVQHFDKFVQPASQTSLRVGRVEPKGEEAFQTGEVDL